MPNVNLIIPTKSEMDGGSCLKKIFSGAGSYKLIPCIDCGKGHRVQIVHGKPQCVRCMHCHGKLLAKGNIGRKASLETRIKISQANRGRKRSNETKLKLSQSLRGKPSPNKGKIFTIEHRQHLSEARRRYFQNPKNRRLQAERMRGYQWSDESRRKLSESIKILRQTTPARGAAVKGSKRSGHFRKLQSERMKGSVMAEETKAKISLLKKNNPQTNYFQKGKDNIMYGKHHTDRERKLISESSKMLWGIDEFRDRVVMASMKANSRKPNGKEMMLSYMLRRICPKEFRYNGDGRLGMVFGGRIPDFVNINGKKQVIEHFGEWWHGERIKGRTKIEEEQKCLSHYKKYGYSCLIIWESELKVRNGLKHKIKEFAENK